MNDPRLNSVHLEAVGRREEFRRAREQLLAARGHTTITFESNKPIEEPPNLGASSPTRPPRSRNILQLWLYDRDRGYLLKVGLNHIGRMPDNDIVISDPSVSRRHCTILVHSDLTAEIHDTASRNGTFVNGQKVMQPTRIHPGDQILICDRALYLRSNLDQTVPPKLQQQIAKPDNDNHTCIM